MEYFLRNSYCDYEIGKRKGVQLNWICEERVMCLVCATKFLLLCF